MLTVLRIDGIRIVIDPNDHRPPHVHVRGAGPVAIFVLHCPDGPPTLRGSQGFTTTELNRLAAAVAAALATLCREWEKIHGYY